MEFVLFFAFAVVFAMAFNYVMPRLNAKLANYPKIASHQSSYWGQTLITAVGVFVLLMVVGFVFSAAGVKARAGGVSA